MCRPECMVSTDCSQDKTCINQKCVDPCPGTCGLNARCQIVNHNPICSCQNGYTGDPFIQCYLEPSKALFQFYSHSIHLFIFSLNCMLYFRTTCC